MLARFVLPVTALVVALVSLAVILVALYAYVARALETAI
jgi:hypothetical protein